MATIKELLNQQVMINKTIASGVKAPEVAEVVEQKQYVEAVEIPENIPAKREKKARK